MYKIIAAEFRMALLILFWYQRKWYFINPWNSFRWSFIFIESSVK